MYRNLKQSGISHATPTHRGTTAGYQQSRVTHAIPVKITGTRNAFPKRLTHNDATPITKLTAACNSDNLIYVKCTDDLSRSGRSVNAKFAVVNVRSVRNKADLIKEHVVEQNYDIVALTETWLTKDDQAEINVLTASGYSLCHLPRANKRGGGVGVLFKSTLSKISETPLTTDTFEGLSVTLQCPKTKNNVRVYVIYRPPSSSLPRDFLDDLGAILKSAATHPGESIICGDFNVHFGNTHSTAALNLANLLENAGFVQHVTSATHVSGNILDLLITHQLSSMIASSVRSTHLLTDHHVVECDITVSKPARPKRTVTYRKYSSIDKCAFATDIIDAFGADPGTNDELVDVYNATIATVLNTHAPILTRVITVRPKTPWHTEDLSRAKRELRSAERRWQKTRLVVHRQIFTTLRNAYHQQLAATKSNHYRTIIHEAVNNVKAMYSVTNDLLGRSASPSLPDCRDDAKLAEEFHHYFTQKIGNIRSITDSRSITLEPLPPTAYPTTELCEFQPASAEDIKRIIVQSSSKPCELDPMPTNLLKDNIETLAPIITDIVNTSLQSGVVPAAMKHAIITPIIKKRGLDVNLYANYRPISSLSVVSKTLERYVALELRRYLDDKCLNDPFQSAYRPGHSTETALVRIHNDLLLSIDSRRSVVLVLLDLTAAFDTLDHTTLLNRLRELGVGRTVLAWFTSYLVGRSNAVKIRQTTSSRQTLMYGVPQGSVLAPILFNIYISPIADIFRRHQIRYHIYADDTQLNAECPPSDHTDAIRQLRDCVDELKRWLDHNHLLLNESKTEAIVFRSATARVTPDETTVNVCGAVVPLLPTIRDIGVILDNGLDMSAQVSNACRGAYFHLFRIAKIRKCLDTAARTI